MRYAGLTAVLFSLSLVAGLGLADGPPPISSETDDTPEASLFKVYLAMDADAARANVKFVGYGGDSSLFLFAVDKVSFGEKCWVRVSGTHCALFKGNPGKEKMGWRMSSKDVELEFDRPVHTLDDLRKAKLQTLKSGNMTMRCGQ
jgi:hypothetical protein